MADDVRPINTGRLKLFDRAVRGKSNKYTWSGLAILVIGLLVLFVGMAFSTTSYPLNVLIIGLGILFMIIGVIRLLIGLISPATPLDIMPITEASASDLDATIFDDSVPPSTPRNDY